ncbi:helix-turn-helix transcriptional regulator [Brevundimonas sp.]|uniref:helix-turn-helix domain-containing protein n=1 Tax=Brevundimonas sp. TaxID=1871086 RepID=UPI00289EB7DD|nr:helix-turn-helix transcriptional regulator [Brevundimonas sp.]
MKNQQPASFYVLLGQRIRKYREARGLTQEALAEKINLGRTSVTNIEKGNQQVLAHQLAMFVDALQVDIDLLMPSGASIDGDKVVSLMPDEADERERDWVRALTGPQR